MDAYNMDFPTVPKSAEDFKPDECLTRGEFVMEALTIWEEQMSAVSRAIARGGHKDADRNKLLARHMDMKIAIRVLKNTYFAEELHNEATLFAEDTRTQEEADARIRRG